MNRKLIFFLFCLTLCFNQLSAQSIKKTHKELFKQLRKNYKIKDAFLRTCDEDEAQFIEAVTKDYKIIITDLQGNAITPFCKSYHYLPEVSDKNTSVYKTLPQAEAAFWVNTGNTTKTTLSTTVRTKSPVSAISPSGLYDTRGHLIKKGSANFAGVELGHYVSVDGRDDYYYQNGEKVAPDKAFSVKMNSDGLFHYMVYSFKENGLTLKGAKSLLDRTEELPTSFYDIKHEGGIDGRWLVKVHFYNNWEQYTPGITTVSPQTYPDAEKYFLDGKYEDCFMALSKDTTINPIVSLLISCSSILDYSQKQRNECSIYINSIMRGDITISDEEYNSIYSKLDFYDNGFGDVIENIKKLNELTKQKIEYLVSIEKRLSSAIIEINQQKRDLDSAIEIGAEIIAERERQARIREEQRIARAEMWCAIAGALVGATLNAVANHASDNNSSYNTASSGGSYRSTSSSNSSSSSYSSSSDDSGSTYREKQKVMKQCPRCDGKGWVVDNERICDPKDKKYCSQCGQSRGPHGHGRCGLCNGSGEVFDKYK